MASLSQDILNPKNTLEEFRSISERILNYLAEVINGKVDYGDYLICSSTVAGTRKVIRPFNKTLFIEQSNILNESYNCLIKIIAKLKNAEFNFDQYEFLVVDKVIYTIQQSIGMGLDLVVEQNSARKHVGNRFEELIQTLLTEMNISMKKVVLSIPYETDEGEKYYRCETDVIISPFESVRSDSGNINPKEIVISLKTTTKDRMPKIFIDKILMQKFLGYPVRMVGISQNDIQRKEDRADTKISYTFVSNLFMVYTKFLTELEGYYYLDIPKKALTAPFNQYIFPFSKFILSDVWRLLNS